MNVFRMLKKPYKTLLIKSCLFQMGVTDVKERPKNKFRIAIELAVNDDITNKR